MKSKKVRRSPLLEEMVIFHFSLPKDFGNLEAELGTNSDIYPSMYQNDDFYDLQCNWIEKSIIDHLDRKYQDFVNIEYNDNEIRVVYTTMKSCYKFRMAVQKAYIETLKGYRVATEDHVAKTVGALMWDALKAD